MSNKKTDLNTMELTSPNPTKEEITKQYKKMALIHHPDKTGGNKEKLQEIANAYQRLLANEYENEDIKETPDEDLFTPTAMHPPINLQNRTKKVTELVTLYMKQLQENTDDIELLAVNYEYLRKFKIEFETSWNRFDDRPWGYCASQSDLKKFINPLNQKIDKALRAYEQSLLLQTQSSMLEFTQKLSRTLRSTIDASPELEIIFGESDAYIPNAKGYTKPLRLIFSTGDEEWDQKRAILFTLQQKYGHKIYLAPGDRKYAYFTLTIDPSLIIKEKQLEYSIVSDEPLVLTSTLQQKEQLLDFCLRQQETYLQMPYFDGKDADTMRFIDDLYQKIVRYDGELTAFQLAQLRGLIVSICLTNPDALTSQIIVDATQSFSGLDSEPVVLTEDLKNNMTDFSCHARVRWIHNSPLTDAEKYSVQKLKEVFFIVDARSSDYKYKLGFSKHEGFYKEQDITQTTKAEKLNESQKRTNWGYYSYNNGDLIRKAPSIQVINNILQHNQSKSILQEDKKTLQDVLDCLPSEKIEARVQEEQIERIIELQPFYQALEDLKMEIESERQTDGLLALHARSRYEQLKKLAVVYVNTNDLATFMTSVSQCCNMAKRESKDSHLTKLYETIIKSIYSILEKANLPTLAFCFFKREHSLQKKFDAIDEYTNPPTQNPK